MSNRVVDFAFLEQDDAQIIVSHPAAGFLPRRPPERFDVSVHRALPPGQHGEDSNDTNPAPKSKRRRTSKGVSRTGNTCASQRIGPITGQIL